MNVLAKITYILLILTSAGCTAGRISSAKSAPDSLKNKEDNKKEAVSLFIDGSINEANGDYENAINNYINALKLDPQPGIYYSIGKDLYYLNRLNLSIQYLKQAVKLDSLNIKYLDVLAQVHLAANQKDSAILAYNKIIAIDSSAIYAYYVLANIYEESRPLSAIKIYNKIIENEGPIWEVLVRLADLYQKTNNIKEAISVYKNMHEFLPSDVGIKRILVELYEKDNQLNEADSLINDILEVNPYDFETRESKAILLIKQNRWNEAVKEYKYLLESKDIAYENKLKLGIGLFNQALKDSTIMPDVKEYFIKLNKDTSDFQTKLILGTIYLIQNNKVKSESFFKSVKENNKYLIETWTRLGSILYDNKKYNETVKVLSYIINDFHDDYFANFILGLSYSQINQNDSAKKYVKKAVELNSRDVNTITAYAYILNTLKEDDEAINYLYQALQLSPNDVNVLGTLGLIYNGRKVFEKSDSAYTKALEIDSSNILINNNFAYSLAERGIRLQEALSMINRALASDSTNSAYLDTKGWVLFKLGNYEEARINIENALKSNPESPTLIDHLGDVYFKLGNKEKALELWKKSYKINNNTEVKNKIDKGEI